MTTQDKRPQKHLDLERRKLIERGVDEGRTFTYIAREVGAEVSMNRPGLTGQLCFL